MKKLLTAIALSIALPAIAHAQSAPAPASKMDCCEKMKAAGMSHDMKMPARHDMSKAAAKTPQPDQDQQPQR